MEYQDLTIATDRVVKMYMNNPNRSISSTFRYLRRKTYVSFIGDYPILYTILNAILTLGISPSRFQTIYALNQSEELSSCSKQEKTNLLNQLLKPSHAQMKSTKNDPRRTKRRKLNSLSF